MLQKSFSFRATTGNSGTAELHLNDLLCRHAFENGERGVPISHPQFTALPTGDAPVVLTAKFALSEIALQTNEVFGRRRFITRVGCCCDGLKLEP